METKITKLAKYQKRWQGKHHAAASYLTIFHKKDSLALIYFSNFTIFAAQKRNNAKLAQLVEQLIRNE